MLAEKWSDLCNNEVMLIYDSKLRWNSLFVTMEGFLRLKSLISSPINCSDNEFNVIPEITSVLRLVKLSMEAISRQDANLVMANRTFPKN